MANWKKVGISIIAAFSSEIAAKVSIWFIMRGKVPRPYPFSLWSPEKIKNYLKPDKPKPAEIKAAKAKGRKVQAADYTSWPSLVDRTYSGRHLGPRDVGKLPDIAKVEAELYRRPSPDSYIPSPRMSVLFTLLAQWFTDSFLRTDPIDRRMNTSNHEIDLCQIYGLTESTAEILRSKKDGKLRSRRVNKEEFPEKLFASNGQVKDIFKDLPYIEIANQLLKDAGSGLGIPVNKRKPYLYATGLERGNSTIGYTSASTIFLREHNRLCDELKKTEGWKDDDRLFQTARIINMSCLLKIIVEDYINALAGELGKFKLVVGYAEKKRWYRANRIALEFDLLYRWHSLVPNTVELLGQQLPPSEFMYNNELVEKHGAEAIINSISGQRAGAMVLHNTPYFLWPAEYNALELSRQFKVQPYTYYCDRFSVTRPASFKELTGDDKSAAELAKLYDDVDKVDFMVGLRAEKRGKDVVLGDLMLNMVGFDAFSHALTNPLLSQNVFMRQTFTEVGLKTIEETSSFQDIVDRNRGVRSLGKEVKASFTV